MLLLFWIFHVFHVFGSLAYPFKYHSLMKSKKFIRRVYAVEIILILILGFLPATIVEVFSDYFFPAFPLICVGSSGSLIFYSHLLPFTIISTFGLCLLFASFWIIHKVSFIPVCVQNFKKTSYLMKYGFMYALKKISRQEKS